MRDDLSHHQTWPPFNLRLTLAWTTDSDRAFPKGGTMEIVTVVLIALSTMAAIATAITAVMTYLRK